MKRKTTRPDLIERFDKLGVTAKAFEKEHGLPRNLIAKMRQGSYGTATETLAKFEAALVKAEGPKASKTAPSATEASVAVVAASGAKGRPREKVADEVEKELLDRIRGDKKTAEEWDALLRYVLELAALGKVSAEYARFANDAISNGRQLAKVKAEEEEKNKVGEPVVVEVTNVVAWQVEGPCPYCAGTGKLKAKEVTA